MKYFKTKIAILLISTSGLFLAFMYACGDGDSKKPTVVVFPVTGDTLLVKDKLVATFSESMDKTSLKLGGTMSSGSDNGTWSKTNVENDTLTIAPKTNWDASAAGTLTIDAKDTSGNALVTKDLDYFIKIKLSTFQKASLVIGQTNLTSSLSGTSSTLLTNVVGSPSYSDGKLIVPDFGNNRILIFNSIPTTNGVAANHVIGQATMSVSVPGVTPHGLSGPLTGQVYKGKVFVADLYNNRVLIFNSLPTTNNASANVVLGQTGFGLNGVGCAASKMGFPYSLIAVKDKLIVSDENNSRILIWNSIPTTNGKNADVVIGQNSFTTCAANDDDQNNVSDATPSARTMNNPQGVWSDGTKLAVIDSSNNRILIWNTFPTTNFKNADVVLGQGDFTHHAVNDANQDNAPDAGPSSKTLSLTSDEGLTSNGLQLFVTDTGNNRVLGWNTFPTTNFQAADIVLGQGDFVHYIFNDANQDGTPDASPSAKAFSYPDGISLIGNQLMVTDNGNSRLLIFNGQ